MSNAIKIVRGKAYLLLCELIPNTVATHAITC